MLRMISVLLLLAMPAYGHDHYSNWRNGKDQNCCNDQDCRAIPDTDERTVAGRLEVKVEGTWCPVLPHHYLKKGNAPNWQTSHICVVRKLDEGFQCERFICYQPKPGF